MAQRRRGTYVGRRSLLARLGLTGGRGVSTALVALACVGAGIGAYRQVVPSGIVIERAEGQETVPQEADAGTKEAGEGQPMGPSEGSTEERRCIVHVDGAVLEPGVVELHGPDLRVTDAVEAAGGLADGAVTTGVNLAEPLADGAKIHIPSEEELAEAPVAELVGQRETSGATGDGAATLLVNVNTATLEELTTLPGVGEATATAIIEEREANGPFASPEDVMRVSGIGEKKLARMRDMICV